MWSGQCGLTISGTQNGHRFLEPRQHLGYYSTLLYFGGSILSSTTFSTSERTRSWSGDRECGVDCSSDGHRIPRARLWIIHWAKHLLMATRRSYSLAHVVEKTKGGTCGKVCTESCDLPKNLVPSLHSTVTGSCQLSQARSVPLHHSDYSNSHFKIWKWIWIEVDHEDDKIVILYISTATS